MNRPTIAVIFGGCSTEHDVSLHSATAVLNNWDSTKYRPVMIGITRQGRWLHYTGPIERIENGSWERDASCRPAMIVPDRSIHGILFADEPCAPLYVDAAFPILHGQNGEDGTLQGLLEMAGIPCVGCGMLSSALCMDKEIAHKLAQAAGIAVADFITLHQGREDVQTAVAQAETLGFPLFVKPVRSGSSIGITRVTEREQLGPAIEQAFQHDDKVVIEQAIQGCEVGCAILGNELCRIGAVDEMELHQDFLDYEEKYALKTTIIHMPARFSPQKTEEIQHTALRLYRLLQCRGFARVDLFVTPSGRILFNEINTIPGLTPLSRYPRMMKEIGLSFTQVIDEMIDLAVRV